MAFPTTSVLDSFTRADNGSLGANYGAFVSGDSRWGIVSNQAGSSLGNWSNDVWSTAPGNDQEAYFTFISCPDAMTIAIYARVQEDGTATPDGYGVSIAKASGTDTWAIVKMTNNVESNLGATFSQELSNGDAVGIEIIGTTITAYYKASGGSWTALANRTDSTYSSGKIGFGCSPIGGQRALIDDFGGGTVASGATSTKTGSGIIGP